MRVQTKPLVAQATRWMGFPTSFVVPEDRIFNILKNPLRGVVRYPHNANTGAPVFVKHGDYVVKYPHTQIVDVFSPEEFHKRFNLVEPSPAVEFVPTAPEMLAPYHAELKEEPQ